MADVATLLADAQSKMNKAVEVAKDDFGAIRTGRAHPAMFNKIMVDSTEPTQRSLSSPRSRSLNHEWQ